MSLEFDDDDMPSGYPDVWGQLTERLHTDWCSPQLAYYRRNSDAINAWRRQTRRPKPRKAVRTYAGVPVVVRRAVRAHVAEVRRMQQAARKAARR